MRSLLRSRVPAGVSTGGQFATDHRREPAVTLTSRAGTASSCLQQLAERDGWHAVMPLPSAQTPPEAAVTPGTGVVLQLHRCPETPEAVFVELDPDRSLPWARPVFFELRGEELSRVASRDDGSRYRTFIGSGITGPEILADVLDRYLRR
ncbi:hypothetical protein [Pseudactinotalea terrae]|uniref:hypothetical protein n=1 Tax=Pseudactinotalea terrae TaxID=1743262 RepID=UPI0012E22F90|nr:hypothetical protein [Pseudactinotalea terrae]